MNTINFNNADYYITGTTVWDDGRQREFDDYRCDPIVCPRVHRYDPEALVNDLPKGRVIPPGGSIGYTDTFLTCVKLTAAEHEMENLRREEHFARMLEERDR